MIQQEGPGWRLAKDSSRSNFSIIIGGDRWAIELNSQEWNSLVPIVIELIEQHQKIKTQLMPEESICLEMEKTPWWACLEGDQSSWSMQLILEGNGSDLRGFEAYWPIPAAQAIANAMRTMWDSSP